MPSDGRDEEIKLLVSGYNDDISGTDSEATTVIAARGTASDKPIEADSEQYESQHNDSVTGAICIGCNVRDAGPGVVDDKEAQSGTIWIHVLCVTSASKVPPNLNIIMKTLLDLLAVNATRATGSFWVPTGTFIRSSVSRKDCGVSCKIFRSWYKRWKNRETKTCM